MEIGSASNPNPTYRRKDLAQAPGFSNSPKRHSNIMKMSVGRFGNKHKREMNLHAPETKSERKLFLIVQS